MQIELRPYQTVALKKIEEALKTGNDFVLASCPSSGKTVIAIHFIRKVLSKRKAKFLIVTHGQNVLKDMWRKELQERLTPFEQKQVTYGLPQSLHTKDVTGFDFIIVDEAHEFTFATMTKKILSVNPKAKKIYLTGTPSKFIAENLKQNRFNIHIIPAIELIHDKHISEVYFGLFSTTAKLGQKDWNSEGDVTNADALVQSTKTDLEELFRRLSARLRSVNGIKNKPYVSKLTKDWSSVFGGFKKTMIACQSIKQAAEVEKFLRSKKVAVLSSNNENDPKSENIQRFLNDDSVTVLVVVDRGILGFNMPDLVNVVDFTCSKNIDRIYQLFARVMRKNPNEPYKYFYRIVPNYERDMHLFYLQAACCLMFKDFVSVFNGKNLKNTLIPVRKIKRERKEGGGDGGSSISTPSFTVDKDLETVVNASEIMEHLFAKANENFDEYAFTTIDKIRKQYTGRVDLSTIQGMIITARQGLKGGKNEQIHA